MDRQAWLQERRKYLGASEVAAVCGLCPFGSPLTVWASKRGILTMQDSPALQMGRLFETPLLAYYAAKNKRFLTQPGLQVKDWRCATPDAIADSVRNVQVKVVGGRAAWKWDDGVPVYVLAQVQWEMFVTELAITDVVACIGGTDYREHQVLRDDAAIADLDAICHEFWQRYVIGGEMPAPDASEEAKRILAARWPQHMEALQPAPDDVRAMAERYAEINKAVAAVEEEQAEIANRLRAAIGPGEGFTWDGGKVTWKTNKAGERTLRVHIKEKRCTP